MVTLLIIVIILGVVVYLVQMAPLPQPFKWAAIAIVCLIAILYLLSLLPGHGRLV
jgi:hypothetical protein